MTWVTFPKGNRKREKALAKRAQGAWVVQVRAEVWERSRGRCETCGGHRVRHGS